MKLKLSHKVIAVTLFCQCMLNPSFAEASCSLGERILSFLIEDAVESACSPNARTNSTTVDTIRASSYFKERLSDDAFRQKSDAFHQPRQTPWRDAIAEDRAIQKPKDSTRATELTTLNGFSTIDK